MSAKIDLTGQTFGRLKVIGPAPGQGRWIVRCECGAEKTVKGAPLRDGRTKSCGCYARDVTVARSTRHGQAARTGKTPEWHAWVGMNSRCHSPTDKLFPYYGGRGITVADEWRRDFSSFFAHIGPRPSPRHSIDRIDNARGYEPGNVRWATRHEQMRNTRRTRFFELNGEKLCLKDWAARFGVDYKGLHAQVTYRNRGLEAAVAHLQERR